MADIVRLYERLGDMERRIAALEASREPITARDMPEYVTGSSLDLDDPRYQAKFVECPSCRAKPGTPVLCEVCLANRGTIERLRRALETANGLARQWKLNYDNKTPARDQQAERVDALERELGSTKEQLRVMTERAEPTERERDETKETSADDSNWRAEITKKLTGNPQSDVISRGRALELIGQRDNRLIAVDAVGKEWERKLSHETRLKEQWICDCGKAQRELEEARQVHREQMQRLRDRADVNQAAADTLERLRKGEIVEGKILRDASTGTACEEHARLSAKAQAERDALAAKVAFDAVESEFDEMPELGEPGAEEWELERQDIDDRHATAYEVLIERVKALARERREGVSDGTEATKCRDHIDDTPAAQ